MWIPSPCVPQLPDIKVSSRLKNVHNRRRSYTPSVLVNISFGIIRDEFPPNINRTIFETAMLSSLGVRDGI